MTQGGDQRRADRRTSDRRGAGSPTPGCALVPVGELKDETPSARPPRVADPAFSAQLLGQEGQKRGLRGGAPVLNAARSAYLEAEYSGRLDRRPPKGVAKIEDV